MSEQFYVNKSQTSELMQYISDNIKIPVLGAGGGFAPIGTINSYMGTVAPIGWLVCDGTVYNIADYPDLATHIASQFGSTNFFGGNGTTTFGVPDLRGEFLRGSGTNSHENQGSGANVGVHQDGTQHNIMYQDSGQAVYIQDPEDSNKQFCANPDSRISINGTYIPFSRSASGTSTGYPSITSRPTNTSVLFIVKATVSGDANAHQYSTDEQIVGTTEDGEFIYEKTYDNLSVSVPSSGWQEQALSISNMESLVDCKLFHNGDGGTYTSIYYPTEVSIATGNYLGIRSNGLARTIVKIVLQYTKTQ